MDDLPGRKIENILRGKKQKQKQKDKKKRRVEEGKKEDTKKGRKGKVWIQKGKRVRGHEHPEVTYQRWRRNHNFNNSLGHRRQSLMARIGGSDLNFLCKSSYLKGWYSIPMENVIETGTILTFSTDYLLLCLWYYGVGLLMCIFEVIWECSEILNLILCLHLDYLLSRIFPNFKAAPDLCFSGK